MDVPFFLKAMKAVGIPVTIFDEDTPMTDKPDIHIIRKEHYRARKDYPCAWAHPPNSHIIQAGRHYVRIVWEDSDGSFQHDHVCLDCWVKP